MSLPLVQVKVSLPNGDLLTRTYTTADESIPAPEEFAELLEWLTDADRAWEHPQDPIVFSGRIKPEHEADVRSFLEVQA